MILPTWAEIFLSIGFRLMFLFLRSNGLFFILSLVLVKGTFISTLFIISCIEEDEYRLLNERRVWSPCCYCQRNLREGRRAALRAEALLNQMYFEELITEKYINY